MGKKGKNKGGGNREDDGKQPSSAPGAAPQPASSSAGASPGAPAQPRAASTQQRPSGPPPQQSAAQNQPQPSRQTGGQEQVIISIPGNKVGLIIGTKGSTKKRIEDSCKVKLWVDQQSRDAGENSKPLQITGDANGIAQARQMISELIEPSGRSQGQQGPSERSQGQQGPPQSQRQQGPPERSQGQQGPWKPQGQQGPPQSQRQQGPPERSQGQQGPWKPQGQQEPPQSQRQQGPPERSQGQQGQQGPKKPQGQQGQQGQQGPHAGRAPPLSAPSSKQPSVDRSSVTSPAPSDGSSGDSLASSFSQMGLPKGRKGSDYPSISCLIPKRADRPQDPKKGRRMIVETNHLSLKLVYKTVYHYDVKIEPEKPFRMYRPALREFQRMYYPNNFPSFDGKKNLYSMNKLPFKGESLTGTVTVNDPEREQPKEITVTLTIAAEVDLSTIEQFLQNGTSLRPPQDAIQALDIVLRQPSAARFCQVGRSYFSPPPQGSIISLGDGMDLWYGFFQSAILGGKPFLNIDVAHKGFPAPVNCIEALKEFCRGNLDPNQPVDRWALQKLSGLVKGLKVVYEVPPHFQQRRTYKVLDIGLSPRDTKFQVQDRGQMNVERYFMETYQYRIRYPLVPCLKCGSPNNPISLPAELCRIMEGQIVLKKLNEEQTRNMVRQAARPADERKRKIVDSMMRVNFNSDPHIKEFGIEVGRSFEQVDARVLEPPNIDYKQNSVQVRKGVWNSSPFIKAGSLDNWVIYNCERRTRPNEMDYLEKQLQQVGRTLGMNVAPARKDNMKRDDPREVESCFSNCRKNNVQLLFVILPDRGQVNYATIKQIAEIHIGVLTQCLKYRTVSKLSPATVTNILLKVNAKVNGINHYIGRSPGTGWPAFLGRPVMVVGADVTHPSPDQQSIPSVAAVAASHDAKAFHYNMKWRLQQPRQEMIEDLEEIMKEQMMLFYKRSGLKPEHILFYRDGVSEGQFSQVLEIEVQAIKKACKAMGDNYEPPITFLVVQKRHHTRFFPIDPRDADGKNKNVPAGTIVDTKITHKHELDFYLVSHASIQGTSRPTKYHVLWDDVKMSEQVLQEITYYLCHLFTRCTRSVSYPAPTYYAHLAAFRIRSYIENQQIRLNSLAREQSSRTVKPEIMNNCPMFFV